MELGSGRTYVTSQNHGYEVVAGSVPAPGKVTHLNANDGSCEGASYEGGRIFTVQFHPEACCGPTDTSELFDRFLQLMEEAKGKGEN